MGLLYLVMLILYIGVCNDRQLFFEAKIVPREKTFVITRIEFSVSIQV